MPEKLRLYERLGDRSAGDCDKRKRCPITQIMNRPGDEFLSGPAIAGNEHRRVQVGDTAYQLVDAAHRSAHSDKGVAPWRLIGWTWQRLGFPFPRELTLHSGVFVSAADLTF